MNLDPMFFIYNIVLEAAMFLTDAIYFILLF